MKVRRKRSRASHSKIIQPFFDLSGSSDFFSGKEGGQHFFLGNGNDQPSYHFSSELTNTLRNNHVAFSSMQPPVWLSYAAAVAVLIWASRGSECSEFESDEEAQLVEKALRIVLLTGELAIFGKEVTALWASYLARTKGDSLAHIPLTSDAVMAGFRNSKDTESHQDFLVDVVWAVLPDFCQWLPENEWHAVPVNTIIPQHLRNHKVMWTHPFELPANIAGEAGESDAGKDSRKLDGFVAFYRQTDEAGRTTAIYASTNFQMIVKDAVDFCPGNMGAHWQRMFTVSLSRLEEHGEAYDAPFLVDFDLPVRDLSAPQEVVNECQKNG